MSRLQEIRAAEGDAVVYVRGDKKAIYGDVMELLGLVGQSGSSRVSLLSQHSPTEVQPATAAPLPQGAPGH